MERRTKASEWHLDRRVTLGLIGALLVNAGSSVWWAATLTFQVDSNKGQIAANKKGIDAEREERQKDVNYLRNSWLNDMKDLRREMNAWFVRIDDKIDLKQDKSR